MFSFHLLRCPGCAYWIMIDVGVEEVLGPPLIICKRCQNEVHTHLREWPALSAFSRLLYLAVSLLAAVFGAYFLAGGLYVLVTGRLFSDAAWRDPFFLALYAGFAAATALARLLFVILSLKRTRQAGPLLEVSLTTARLNAGLYYTLAVILLIVLDYFLVYQTQFAG